MIAIRRMIRFRMAGSMSSHGTLRSGFHAMGIRPFLAGTRNAVSDLDVADVLDVAEFNSRQREGRKSAVNPQRPHPATGRAKTIFFASVAGILADASNMSISSHLGRGLAEGLT